MATTFPQVPLPVSVHIAPGANPADATTYTWTEITTDIRYAEGVQIQCGAQDEGNTVDTTTQKANIDNRSGNYSTRNPLGTWYGSLSKGTPMQTRVMRINDQFARTVASGLGTDADSGIAWSANSYYSVNGTNAVVSIPVSNTFAMTLPAGVGSADFDAMHTSAVSVVPVGAAWVHAVVFWYAGNEDFYRAHTEFDPTGVIKVKVTRRLNGTENDLLAITSTGVTYSAGTLISTRVQVLGSVVRFKVWPASGSEPTSWSVQGSLSGTTTINGAAAGLFAWRVGGMTTVPTGSIDNFRFDSIRATTPVPEWPPRWNQTATVPTTPVVGAGALRRLSQGQSALRSPIYRQLVAQPVCGYWPLEDGSSSSTMASAVVGGAVATGTGFSLGSTDCPAGASSAATLNTAGTSTISGRVTSWTVAQNGYACMAYFRLPTLSASSAPIPGNKLMTITTAGTVVRWIIYTTSTGFYIEGYASDGTLIVNTGSFDFGITPSKWFAVELQTQESGSTVNWSLVWTQVGSTTFTAGTGSYTGTADRITAAAVYAPVDGTLVSHLWAGDDALQFVDGTFMKVSAGYAGELAGSRVVRLSSEEGVPMLIVGDTADTAPMGVQTAATYLDLMRECEAADQGVLHERGAGLAFMTRVARYNQTPVMTLDFNSGHVAAPPEPTDDDQRLRNSIRLTRTGGSEVVLENAASITANGTYSDDVTVNLQADTQLQYHAGWRLHLGTLDDLRWPRIELDLAATPSLIGAWCQVLIGSRITIANPPAAVAGASLDLIIEGWTESISLFSWNVVLVCSPASAWNVGVYGDTTKRYDSRATTLNATAAAGATTLVLTFPTPSDAWSTKAASQPYDLLIAGEQVRVPVGGMGAVTGTGPYTQTITGAVRAINGISKSLPAGSAVHIATPARYAL